MNILIILLWMLLFLIIPISVILVAGSIYGRDKTSLIIGKLLISSFVYLAATIISFIFSVLIAAGAERRGEPMAVVEQIIALGAIYFYGLFGYLLCSFLNGVLFKPWKFTLFNSKKPQSIFNEK